MEQIFKRIAEESEGSNKVEGDRMYNLFAIDIVLSFIRDAFESYEADNRSECVMMLRKMTQLFSTRERFKDLVCLINVENDDRDFFVNISHIQLHRVTVGLNILREKVLGDSISHSNMAFLFMPLVKSVIMAAENVFYVNMYNCDFTFLDN